MYDRMKRIEETLMTLVESQMCDLSGVDTEELGDVIDMIKDLQEATYYCAVTKAMEESKEKEHHGEQIMYYSPMYYGSGMREYYTEKDSTDWRDMPRSYYSNGGSSSGQGGGSSGRGGNYQGGSSSGQNGSSQYTEREFPGAFQDKREGRSPRSRRMYMEAKETHQDKNMQMRELEKYMQELAQDITEMIEGSSPEERQYLSKKISALATKVIQKND